MADEQDQQPEPHEEAPAERTAPQKKVRLRTQDRNRTFVVDGTTVTHDGVLLDEKTAKHVESKASHSGVVVERI